MVVVDAHHVGKGHLCRGQRVHHLSDDRRQIRATALGRARRQTDGRLGHADVGRGYQRKGRGNDHVPHRMPDARRTPRHDRAVGDEDVVELHVV